MKATLSGGFFVTTMYPEHPEFAAWNKFSVSCYK
jgi:hypothetical protein